MKLKRFLMTFMRVVTPDAAETTIRFALEGSTVKLGVLNMQHDVEKNEWVVNLRKLDS